jgi:para-aminobenzoate synthetase component I
MRRNNALKQDGESISGNLALAAAVVCARPTTDASETGSRRLVRRRLAAAAGCLPFPHAPCDDPRRLPPLPSFLDASHEMLLTEEIPWLDPTSAVAPWADDAHVCWLDSAAENDVRSQFAYLCVEPFQVLEQDGGRVALDGRPLLAEPLDALRRELTRWRLDSDSGPAPFVGGAVGFLGYEALSRGPHRLDDLDVPDMCFGFYDVTIAFDLAARRVFVVSSGFPETSQAARRSRASARLKSVLAKLATAVNPGEDVAAVPFRWRFELTRKQYEGRVARILDYIRAGDIYQANFTTRYVAPREGRRPIDIYRALRRASPAPFAAFLRCGRQLALASASPERFLRMDGAGRISTRPIKGSRPRFDDPALDRKAAADLAASVKDRAENLMIVDLMRNDLGRVAALGSVYVPSLFEIESFASMHHMASEIRARLRPGCDAVDLLRAAFPPGSVTGAPKIRAMQIIEELEPTRRGPYCGALLWIGFDGAMDSSVVIRTLVVTPERVVAQAGGGIVADSDPGEEYDEQAAKARPLLNALGAANWESER